MPRRTFERKREVNSRCNIETKNENNEKNVKKSYKPRRRKTI